MTLKKALDLYPDRVGVVDGDRSFTYAEIGDRVTGLARFFQAQAIQPQTVSQFWRSIPMRSWRPIMPPPESVPF